MIRWIITEDRLPGFTYYPLLEMGVGVFLMLAAIAMPIVFVAYNGVKMQQWPELLFVVGFFVLFIFMGKNLTFQSMHARVTADGFAFYQNMREPAVEHRLNKADWLGIRTSEEKSGEETFILLKLKTANGELDFYKSINRKEISKMVGALEELHNKVEEERK